MCIGFRGGIPDQLMQSCNHAAKIYIAQVPPSDEAVRQFMQDGGYLTLFNQFGSDLLANSPQLQHQRQDDFNKYIPDFSIVFHKLVNDDPQMFRCGLKQYIHITEILTQNV